MLSKAAWEIISINFSMKDMREDFTGELSNYEECRNYSFY